ncbi:MAG: hypothetical protein V9E89_00565 [Ilumatobacteraceae bacterium]
MTTDSPTSALAALPRLLRDDPAIIAALGNESGFVAVPEAARAFTIAALAQLSDRRPLVVACATGSDAGQLYDDLAQYLPAGAVALFPAWETLPFERVSPSVETMGRRLEVLWRLRTPGQVPRWWSPACAPCCNDSGRRPPRPSRSRSTAVTSATPTS